ncbi:solute carrier family 25 (mitochondrial carnitine/acylcarnitine transporter), member 20/29 [Kwoniella heveanensis CBS 569]|uniref:Solute carrier family 25 (Mitochondrial carnitine/acylcarnitine transporter), member 20/29 n=1 Tax=Kwoniella heveanensis BCC8398 TaxID=1296120 RepID=A0A1B9GV06_9TREE|nr:solute carrier family 25 (mitochondrial carnitine/acylcarnitine transporter), member 20/29 [Kwoniella heveanensis BCC8398]OCF42180.1 solute carrier family 25 (mitochondrial carnitine/acylcarnitine transporter), member 20/29 [Kwoniella heveanensis CBS 569]
MSDDASEIEASSAKQTVDPIKSFLSGGFGGISCVLVGHPFDLTKTRLQTAAPGTYSGAVDVVRKTIAQDGIRGMYRGITPPILGVTPIFAISFWGYDLGKRIVYSFTPNRTSQHLSIGELAMAGGFSAVPATLVAAPAERVKVLLQVQGQGGQSAYSGPIDVVRKLYAEGGLRSLFRGTGATLLRDGPGSAVYFATYELLKKALSAAPETLPNGEKAPAPPLSLPAVMLAGGSAGVAMWSLAIPPDTIKSRLQSAPHGTYTGFMDCARKLIAADGVTALWKGFGPAMARAFPANAATFVGVELSLKAMDKLW